MQRAYERKNRRGVIWIYSGFSDLCIDGRLFYDFFVVSPPCLFAFYSSVYFPWLWTSSADKFVVLLFSLAVSLMGDGIPIQAIENARVNPLPTESDVFDFSYIPSLFFCATSNASAKKSSIVLNMCFRWGGTAIFLFSFSVLTVTFRWDPMATLRYRCQWWHPVPAYENKMSYGAECWNLVRVCSLVNLHSRFLSCNAPSVHSWFLCCCIVWFSLNCLLSFTK